MVNMKIETVSALVLSYCIEFLRKRPSCTKYRPKDNEFFLDSKMIARIVRYNGDFRAETSQSELKFFSEVIKNLISMSIVELPSKNELFEIKEDRDYKYLSIRVKKISKFFRKNETETSNIEIKGVSDVVS